MSDPLPCPFCGKPAETSAFSDTQKFVRCPDDCTDHFWLRIEAWNRRAVDPRLAKLVRVNAKWRNSGELGYSEQCLLLTELDEAFDALPPDLLAACGVKRG